MSGVRQRLTPASTSASAQSRSGFFTPSKPRLAIAAAGTVLLGILLVLEVARPGGREIIKIKGMDPVCYFATAHSLLFDHDFDLTNEFAVMHPPDSPRLRRRPETGLQGSPYAIGTSLLEIPFLAAGTLADRVAGRRADGYGRGATTGYFVGLIAFVTIGLLCLRDALALLAEDLFPSLAIGVREWTASLVALVLLPGTTLGYYAFSPMAHAAGFMSVAVFLRWWTRSRGTNAIGTWAFFGVLGGLATLCRWQNLLLMPAPLLSDLLTWRRQPPDRNTLLARARCYLVYGATALVVFSPQFIQWKRIYAKLILNPQGSDFLTFPPRFIPEVLFSTKQGWFVWTPVCLLCVMGLLWGCLERADVFLPWALVLVGEILVIAAVFNNWFGESFGLRMMTCTLSLSAMGLFYLLLRLAPRPRAIAWGAVAAAALFTSLFAVQFRFDLLPKDDSLTPSELLTDKFRMRQSSARRRLAHRCEEVEGTTDGERCVALLEDGLRRFGEDRFLLEALVDAERAAGNARGEAGAQARLNAFLARRLF